jgi:hypothetical protein
MHTKKSKIPWPTKAVMAQIYEKHLWGGIEFDFYSGEGSHNLKITSPYIDAVTGFLKSQNSSLTVCDLGCGDFNIGKHFVEYTHKYIGIDIVESLIERNKAIFKADNLEFHCLDISKDELPKADCVILRQVLQHLSNPEINNVINKLANYKYIILTEHVPLGDFEPNKDIITGQGIRLKQNSGVDILTSPFNLEIIEEVMRLNIVLESNRDCIATSIYRCF